MTAARRRIAIAGAGLVGKRHIAAISESSTAVVSAIADPDPRAKSLATDHGVAWYPSVADMLSDHVPDGVIIATPNAHHVGNGIDCVEAGWPVLVEKPISDSVTAGRRLVDRAERAGIPLLVGHHRRHNPIVQAAKERIDAGAIGKLVAVNGMCWLYKPDEYFKENWRTRHGAGPIFINLIHDIDLLRYLVGEIRTVQALDSHTMRGHEVEDTAAILLGFANGAVGTFSVSDTIVGPWSWELTAEENPAYPATGQTCYFLGGSHGALEIPTGTVWSAKDKRGWWEPISAEKAAIDHQDPFALQIDHFCDVIAGRSDPLVSGLEGLKSLQVIEAIKESAQIGRPVHLKDG